MKQLKTLYANTENEGVGKSERILRLLIDEYKVPENEAKELVEEIFNSLFRENAISTDHLSDRYWAQDLYDVYKMY